MMLEEFSHSNVVLFSGGLDSLCTAIKVASLNRDVLAVYCDGRHTPGPTEGLAAEELARRIGVPFARFHVGTVRGEGKNQHSRLRNVVMAVEVAARYRGREPLTIWLGGLADDRVEDKTKGGCDVLGAALTANSPGVVYVDSPWWNHGKAAMVGAARRTWDITGNGESFEDLANASVSCYSPPFYAEDAASPRGCGRCKSCVRKFIALHAVGIQAGRWVLSPATSEEFERMYSLAKAGEYAAERNRTTIEVYEGLRS